MAALSTTALALLVSTSVAAGPAAATPSAAESKPVTLKAKLSELNGSGASGTATAVVRGTTIERIKVKAKGLSPDAPHAQHIHYGDDARNECPSLFDDRTANGGNADGRINTVEGIPAYGPVVVSLTTSGDTSPDSVLAVDRYPVAEDGVVTYRRSDIPFTDVAGTGYQGGGTAQQIADSVRDGEGVVVIHGLDYDGNGEYSFSKQGASELDQSLPAEATDPAVCGILR